MTGVQGRRHTLLVTTQPSGLSSVQPPTPQPPPRCLPSQSYFYRAYKRHCQASITLIFHSLGWEGESLTWSCQRVTGARCHLPGEL
ncbi:hypothetical protein E2320_020478 [Naja naja]|nr:hypothetical protein E2320_020478 [Naja naja]